MFFLYTHCVTLTLIAELLRNTLSVAVPVRLVLIAATIKARCSRAAVAMGKNVFSCIQRKTLLN